MSMFVCFFGFPPSAQALPHACCGRSSIIRLRESYARSVHPPGREPEVLSTLHGRLYDQFSDLLSRHDSVSTPTCGPADKAPIAPFRFECNQRPQMRFGLHSGPGWQVSECMDRGGIRRSRLFRQAWSRSCELCYNRFAAGRSSGFIRADESLVPASPATQLFRHYFGRLCGIDGAHGTCDYFRCWLE